MEKAVEDAVRLLFKNDALLLENNVAERAIAAKLAQYLVPYFPGHQVDVEYNRHGLESKKVDLPEYCRGGGKKLILPDVVVHQRGHDDENKSRATRLRPCHNRCHEARVPLQTRTST